MTARPAHMFSLDVVSDTGPLGRLPRVEWTPQLRALLAEAASATALLGPRETPTPVRVLRERSLACGPRRCGDHAQAYVAHQYLVLVEGETYPRWVERERVT